MLSGAKIEPKTATFNYRPAIDFESQHKATMESEVQVRMLDKDLAGLESLSSDRNHTKKSTKRNRLQSLTVDNRSPQNAYLPKTSKLRPKIVINQKEKTRDETWKKNGKESTVRGRRLQDVVENTRDRLGMMKDVVGLILELADKEGSAREEGSRFGYRYEDDEYNANETLSDRSGFDLREKIEDLMFQISPGK